MCRLALRMGPARPVTELLDAPHGLSVQAYAPREQQHGNVNVDGTGFAWWRDDDAAPLRYATLAPPWADAAVTGLLPRLRGHTVLAAVRGATPGVGHGTEHVAPFLLGELAVAHNGWVGGFRDGLAATLLRRLPDDLLSALPVVNDSLVVAALIAAHRREAADLPTAVGDALAAVTSQVHVAGQQATLNVAVTDGVEAVCTRSSFGLPGNSLHVHERAEEVVVASEPLDDRAGWAPVRDGTLLHLRRVGARVHLDTYDLAQEPV